MKNRTHGSAMALYTAFLGLVVLPLLLISVDMTRMMVRKVRLANAVDAACTAFIHTPNLVELKQGRLLLGGEAWTAANTVFLYNMSASARLTRLSYRLEGSILIDATVVAECGGEADYWPMMFGGHVVYQLRHSTSAKAKLAGSSNW
jgi:hypothetical protein